MAELVYTMSTSLDGYVVDADGSFAWSAPDAEVHAYINALERPVGTMLLGRRLYEVLTYWETAPTDDESPEMGDYARIWRAADKVVYSTTLDEVSTARTQLERSFDADGIRAKKQAATQEIAIGGPTLAAHALAAGLVDVVNLFVVPVVVGGGTRALPGGLRLELELAGMHRFASGTVHLAYRTSSPQA